LYKEHYKPKGGDGPKEGPTKEPGKGEPEADANALPPGIDDLIQFRITAVDSRYCDDLKAFWATVRKGIQNEESVRPMKHYSQAPEGKGWVVEVRGYTFHAERAIFVRHLLLNSLAERAQSEDAALTDAPAKAGTPAPAPPAGGGKAAAPPKGGPPPTPDGLAKNAEEALQKAVQKRISHVVLYKAESFPTDVAGKFELIEKSRLDEVVTAGSGSSDNKQPTSPQGGGAPQGGAPQTPGGGGKSNEAPAAPDRSTWKSASQRTGGGAAPGGGAHKRTEFVILFVYREPTPSDGLRESAAPAKPGAPSSPGGTGRPAGGSMMPNMPK
jgi:hypothetical protein